MRWATADPKRHAVLDANAGLASLLHVTDEREVAAAGAPVGAGDGEKASRRRCSWRRRGDRARLDRWCARLPLSNRRAGRPSRSSSSVGNSTPSCMVRPTGVGPTGHRASVFRVLYVSGFAVVGLLAGLAVMTRRDDGFDRRVLELVVGGTGGDLTEAIGYLGWLDTPAAHHRCVRMAARAGGVGRHGDRRRAMARAPQCCGGTRRRPLRLLGAPRCCRTTRAARTGKAATTCRCSWVSRSSSPRSNSPKPSLGGSG